MEEKLTVKIANSEFNNSEIILVEDNEVNARILEFKLKKSNFCIQRFVTCDDFLHELEEKGITWLEGKTILLDYHTPSSERKKAEAAKRGEKAVAATGVDVARWLAQKVDKHDKTQLKILYSIIPISDNKPASQSGPGDSFVNNNKNILNALQKGIGRDFTDDEQKARFMEKPKNLTGAEDVSKIRAISNSRFTPSRPTLPPEMQQTSPILQSKKIEPSLKERRLLNILLEPDTKDINRERSKSLSSLYTPNSTPANIKPVRSATVQLPSPW